ncbi:MAG: beta-lactamase family protein, partial [Eudoraea sp.]|nr:beta-lactamase family protein [Eudoraea sp.]
MRRISIILFLCSLTIGNAQTESIKKSPPLTKGTAASVAMSEERLAKIEAMLQDAVEANNIPGAVALIARNGKIVFHKAYGMADNASGRNLKEDDIFRIASQT